ncbi:MAG: hypothetical protein IBX40_12045 [Methanosarcinales archaeon]|nr:hypothetical protein [Methanosarcinales archaeon]
MFDDPIPKNYYDVGNWFKNNVNFTYFYIYDGDSDKPFLVPGYSDDGLKYGNMLVSQFQNRYIGSFISTEIEPTTGTAKDESLHDIEFIRPKYQSKSEIKNTRIFGKMFIKKDFSKNEITENIQVDTDGNGNITVNDEDPFKVIFVGGELNYGFGKIEKLDSSLIQLPELSFKFDLSSKDKVCIEHIDKNPILSHLRYSETYQFCGDIELISGRGYEKNKDNLQRETHREPGKRIAPSNLCFTPGTVVHNLKEAEIDYSGVWNSL